MNIEELRAVCLSLPAVTEDVKWGNDLCFCIGGKMFCVTGLQGPFSVSLKVRDDEFTALCFLPNIAPAPYLARYKWINISDEFAFGTAGWEQRIRISYFEIRNKLPAKVRGQLP